MAIVNRPETAARWRSRSHADHFHTEVMPKVTHLIASESVGPSHAKSQNSIQKTHLLPAGGRGIKSLALLGLLRVAEDLRPALAHPGAVPRPDVDLVVPHQQPHGVAIESGSVVAGRRRRPHSLARRCSGHSTIRSRNMFPGSPWRQHHHQRAPCAFSMARDCGVP